MRLNSIHFHLRTCEVYLPFVETFFVLSAMPCGHFSFYSFASVLLWVNLLLVLSFRMLCHKLLNSDIHATAAATATAAAAADATATAAAAAAAAEQQQQQPHKPVSVSLSAPVSQASGVSVASGTSTGSQVR